MAKSSKSHQIKNSFVKGSSYRTLDSEMPSEVLVSLSSNSSTDTKTSSAPIPELVEQYSSVLEHSLLIQKLSNYARSDGFNQTDLVDDENNEAPNLLNASTSGPIEPTGDATALELGTSQLNYISSQGLISTSQIISPLITFYHTAYPQVIPDAMISDGSSMVDHSLTWSVQQNELYPNEYHSFTESYANTSHPLLSYPNTDHPKLAAYIHASSSSDLPVSEWLIKNDWEDKRLEKL